MIVVRLGGHGFGEDGGDLVGGEGEAGADDGEGGGELRVVFAEVLGGDEEIVVAGGVEPVADGGPEVAGHERVDEAQLAECARRRNDGHELEDGLDVGCRLGVTGDAVFPSFRRRIDGWLEVEELPSGLEIREPLGVHYQARWRFERRGRVNDCAVDEFSVVGVHGIAFV